MPTTASLTNCTVIRMGLWGIDVNHARWMASETWVANQVVTTTAAAVFYSVFVGQMRQPFGTSVPLLRYTTAHSFFDYIYPPRDQGTYSTALHPPAGPTLNVHAPEAAFRLQRVGADGSTIYKGRLSYPILDDQFFTDLPHRRHVDVARLRPLLAAGTAAWTKTVTGGGVTWTNSIVHRRTFTYTPLTDWQLLPNPIRNWQRWRPYPQNNHTPAEDQLFHPTEIVV